MLDAFIGALVGTLLVIGGCFAILSLNPASPEPHRSGDAAFFRACGEHGFTQDQCEFFRYGAQGKP